MDDAPIIVRLVDAIGNVLQVANVCVDVRFYMRGGGLRYGFDLGRTDGDGVVRTCLAAIQDQLDENRRHFLMDYNTPLSECGDEIGIYVPTPDDLAQREVNRSKYWPDGEPLAKTANDIVRCPEQRFTLRRSGANQFALVCD
jgi:hypothetical protein